jgi:hypothetical protein
MSFIRNLSAATELNWYTDKDMNEKDCLFIPDPALIALNHAAFAELIRPHKQVKITPDITVDFMLNAKEGQCPVRVAMLYTDYPLGSSYANCASHSGTRLLSLSTKTSNGHASISLKIPDGVDHYLKGTAEIMPAPALSVAVGRSYGCTDTTSLTVQVSFEAEFTGSAPW